MFLFGTLFFWYSGAVSVSCSVADTVGEIQSLCRGWLESGEAGDAGFGQRLTGPLGIQVDDVEAMAIRMFV